MEDCHKKPSAVPLYPTRPTHSDVNHHRNPEGVHPLGKHSGERDGQVQRGYRSTPWFHSTLSHAGLSGLPHYILSPRYPTAGRLFPHTASLPTLNIFIILLCVADELLWLGFHYWAECRRTDGERKEEKEMRVSNSVRQAAHGARLMAAKLSTALINTHLS